VGLRYLEELRHLTFRIRSLKVRPYPFSKTSPWCITELRNKNGKRARLLLKTKSDAAAELDRIKIKFRDAGEKALEVTDELPLGSIKMRQAPGTLRQKHRRCHRPLHPIP
jgi:hypothetical protein